MTQHLKQPKSVYFLSFTEVWERYGFYCIQSLMVLYLIKILGFDQRHAYALYSAFTALLYASPVIGGFLADRLLGFRKTIICGALLYIVGYGLLLAHSKYGFYLSLSLLVCAMGYFKANVSSLLGTVYDDHDPRRDSGFTIFYLGINVGSFLGPIIGALLAEHFGYGVGFASSGLGMIFGLATFLYGRRYLGDHGVKPLACKKEGKSLSKIQLATYTITVLAVIGLSFVMPFATVIEYVIAGFSAVAVLYVIIEMLKLPTAKERKKVIALLILFAFSVVFWAYYMLMYSVFILFSDSNVNRVIFGWHIPAAMLTSLVGLFIIILCPFAAKLWTSIDEHPWRPTYGLKFALGSIFQGISFFILVLGCWFHGANYQVALYWFVIYSFVRVLGELSLSPIGLAAVTELSPTKLVGTMMGIWFLTIAGGLILANYLADLAIVPQHASTQTSLHIYSHALLNYAIASVVIGLVLAAFTPWLKKLTFEKESH
jgi:POT family proton-dependent oligopeptide transporter